MQNFLKFSKKLESWMETPMGAAIIAVILLPIFVGLVFVLWALMI